MEKKVTCPNCDGAGSVGSESQYRCEYCSAIGHVLIPHTDHRGEEDHLTWLAEDFEQTFGDADSTGIYLAEAKRSVIIKWMKERFLSLQADVEHNCQRGIEIAKERDEWERKYKQLSTTPESREESEAVAALKDIIDKTRRDYPTNDGWKYVHDRAVKALANATR